MASAIVALKTDLTNEELAVCLDIIAGFFIKNRDEITRTMCNFPDASNRPKVLEMALREGVGQLEELNDYEEESALLRDLDEMHVQGVFIYGSDLKNRDRVDLEIEDVPKDGTEHD